MALEGINVVIAKLFISLGVVGYAGLNTYQSILMLLIIVLDLKYFENPQILVL
jgi:hypothetical protein